MQLRLRRLLSEFHTSTPRPYKIFASITSCFSPYVSFVTSPRHPYTNLQVQLVSPALLGSLQLFTASKLVPFSLKPDVKAFKSTSFWHWSAVNYTLSHTEAALKMNPRWSLLAFDAHALHPWKAEEILLDHIMLHRHISPHFFPSSFFRPWGGPMSRGCVKHLSLVLVSYS